MDICNNKIKSAIQLLLTKIAYPFRHDLLYFILLWVSLACVPCYEAISGSHYVYAVYISLLYYCLTYLVVFFLDINQSIGKILKPIVFFSVYIFCILNLYCLSVYNCLLSADFIEIIRGTNFDEVREYFEMYFSVQKSLMFILLISASIAAYIISTKIKIRKWISYIATALLPVSIAMTLHNTGVIYDLASRDKWIFKIDEIVDLRDHLAHPDIYAINDLQPDNIVVILGEAFSKSHSQLYGYDLETNPLLLAKRDEGSLVVFNNITSPKTDTNATFKYLLNTFRLGMEDNCKWYESTSLIEVLNSANYHTAWFSNQNKTGMYDNLPSGHARICDESAFTEKLNGHKYDGFLIDFEISDCECRKAVFYHLMGQHEGFKDRYPANFNIFQSSDYQNNISTRGGGQCEFIAHYDNATLYNDYVVNSLIDKYKDSDAIVFYLSDHGLDIYDTDPEYCGHAKLTPESQDICKKIPFMIYLSPLYQQLRPQMTDKIRRAVNNEYCTDKLIYAIMDIVGLKFADNDDVAQFSLVRDAAYKEIL